MARNDWILRYAQDDDATGVTMPQKKKPHGYPRDSFKL